MFDPNMDKLPITFILQCLVTTMPITCSSTLNRSLLIGSPNQDNISSVTANSLSCNRVYTLRHIHFLFRVVLIISGLPPSTRSQQFYQPSTLNPCFNRPTSSFPQPNVPAVLPVKKFSNTRCKRIYYDQKENYE